MKLLKKTKFQKDGKIIKKYKLFGVSVLRKEILPFKKKWNFLGVKFSCRKRYKNINAKLIESSKLFDKKWYLKQYPEIKKLRIDPAIHYLEIGYKEGKNPSSLFDNDIYLSYYPDILYYKINPLVHYLQAGKKEGRKIFSVNNETNKYEKGKKILLLSHEFSLTGAPIVLMSMAKVLKDNAIDFCMLSPKYGDLEKELLEKNIPYYVEPKLLIKLVKQDCELLEFLSSFDVILFNTIDSLKYVRYMDKINKKICWVHEGKYGYKCAPKVFDIEEAFSFMDEVYSVGNYSKSFTDKYIPAEFSKILLYGIDDVCVKNKEYNEKLTIGICGTISERKGHDILIEAIKKLPQHIYDKCLFKIIGGIESNVFYEKLLEQIGDNKNIVFTGQLSRKDTLDEMRILDVLVCPSRDDPMPTVCTEAMVLEIPVICSDKTGTYSFIEHGYNSFKFEIDKENLSDVLCDVFANKDSLSLIGKRWKNVYDKNFSLKIFENNVLNIFNLQKNIKKKIIMRAAGFFQDVDECDLIKDETKKYIGDNTGNIIFAKYFNSQIDKYYDLEKFNNGDVSEEYSMALFMLANFLRPTFNEDYSKGLLRFLENTNLPVGIISLGAQANLENMNPKEYVKTLDENVKKIAYKMSEKSVSIGVRGEFTYDVLKNMGINNVDIIGCPSWFVNGYKQKDVIKKDFSNDFKTAFYTCWDPYSSWHQMWHKKLLDEALKCKDAKFILQSEFDFLPYYYQNKCNIVQDKDLYEKSVKCLANHFGIEKTLVEDGEKLKNMLEIFTNVGKWEEFVKTRDLCFGFRIHGSIISLKQGVPALPIAPDSRVSELCELFKIPYLKVNTISSDDFNLRDFYERADFEEMNKSYRGLLRNYINFLNKNNIKHKF